MSLKVTVLGSGTSHGVPAIGCDCAVCHSADPRDRRTRASILVELQVAPPSAAAGAVRTILIDTSTDLRAQALAHDIRRIDAILFTHSHADHVMGLDETRRFNQMQKSAIPCYADPTTAAALGRMFGYIFGGTPGQLGGGIPQLRMFTIAGPFSMGGVEVVPVPLLHGEMPVLGYRIGPFAYLTDCSRVPDASWPLLEGVEVVVLDALRDRPHPTHFSLSQALEVVDRMGASRAYFTHICHDLPHAATCARLPARAQLAYDGLVAEVG